MSSEVVVSLRGVSKSFPTFDKPYERLFHLFAPGAASGQAFQALRDVDLDIRRGEAIGIIGKNGAGKSTLLQIICGILQPSTGTVSVSARIAALLELGAGFNPEFTGFENIRLNASLLGLSEAEIDARMSRIIDFAEIGPHVGQLVKTYSSGMFMRLAFAVAVHTDPDVLVVDEALSVGDIYFQRKCFKRIEEMRDQGCTLLFVTHSVDSVLQLCERAVVVDGGRIAYDGEAQDAVKAYLRIAFGDASGARGKVPLPRHGAAAAASPTAGQEDAAELQAFLEAGPVDCFASRPGYNRDETRIGEGGATTCDFLVTGSHGNGPLVAAGQPFKLRVRYHFPVAMERLIFGMRLCTVTGLVVYSSNTLVSGGRLLSCDAGSVVVAEFDLYCALLRGQYFLTVGVSRHDADSQVHAIDRRTDAIILSVTGATNHAEGIADMQARIDVAEAGRGHRAAT